MQKSSNKLADISVAFAVEILELVQLLKVKHETIICNHDFSMKTADRSPSV